MTVAGIAVSVHLDVFVLADKYMIPGLLHYSICRALEYASSNVAASRTVHEFIGASSEFNKCFIRSRTIGHLVADWKRYYADAYFARILQLGLISQAHCI